LRPSSRDGASVIFGSIRPIRLVDQMTVSGEKADIDPASFDAIQAPIRSLGHATRCEKHIVKFLAFVKRAAIGLWLGVYGATS